MNPEFPAQRVVLFLALLVVSMPLCAPAQDVYIEDVPNYQWEYGCWGTTVAMMMGYWDRNGYPSVYDGPVNGGVAPSTTWSGPHTNFFTFWAARAGHGGRATNDWGHVDNYVGTLPWNFAFKKTNDPWKTEGRAEHDPDCIGDFIGLSQFNWTNMNGESDGNINGYAFNYWDTSGASRINFTPGTNNGFAVRDIQSGVRAFFRYRGYDGDTVSRLADVYTNTPAGAGFTYEDFKREIDAGFPVLMMLQDNKFSRPSDGANNEEMHGVVGFGYWEIAGQKFVRNYNSVESDTKFTPWDDFSASGFWPLRGVITFRPKPKVVGAVGQSNQTVLTWHAPRGTINIDGSSTEVHGYIVQAAPQAGGAYTNISGVLQTNRFSVPSPSEDARFYRVVHVPL